MQRTLAPILIAVLLTTLAGTLFLARTHEWTLGGERVCATKWVGHDDGARLRVGHLCASAPRKSAVTEATRGQSTFTSAVSYINGTVSHYYNGAPLSAWAGGELGDAEPLEPNSPDTPLTNAAADTITPVEISVLVLYTSTVRVGMHNDADAVLALVDVAVAETNEGWAASGIDASLRLAAAEETDILESGSMQTDLTSLKRGDTPATARAHRRRDEVGADIVVLLVGGRQQYCGLSYVQTPGKAAAMADWAFSVVNQQCATGYYSFGHEIGHVLGAMHDSQHSGSNNGLTADAHGHYWLDRYRSVMAYQSSGRRTTRVNRYSSPGVKYGGAPTGTAHADNVAAINSGVARAAQWR